MRQTFVEGGTRYLAGKACPWAAVIAKVEGGWLCFESVADYRTWKG
jgi:hypothetical protein